MASTIPSTLKAAALKQIALKCGISTSGTKALLTQRLQDELPHFTSLDTRTFNLYHAEKLRILSIDMGIRNFSYCLLEIIAPPDPNLKPIHDFSNGILDFELPPSSNAPKKRSKSKAKVEAEAEAKAKTKANIIPILQAWDKLSLLPQTSTPSKSKSKSKSGSKTDTKIEIKEKVPNEFTPAILSSAAYKLLRNKLLPLSPTHILIERQRFRSMGSSHILEWTIRVNMLESMLWATLKTLSEEKVWNGKVVEIAPRKVGSFWIEETELSGSETEPKFTKVRNSKEAKIRNKGAKVDLVRKWLEADDKGNPHQIVPGKMVHLGSAQVQDVKELYTEKWDRKVGRMKKLSPKSKALSEDEGKQIMEVKEEVGKLDDLADCLLQGVAWLKWQENRQRAIAEGVEVLLG